jgi:hypothetical protein
MGRDRASKAPRPTAARVIGSASGRATRCAVAERCRQAPPWPGNSAVDSVGIGTGLPAGNRPENEGDLEPRKRAMHLAQ